MPELMQTADQQQKTALIMAGGTGGHIFPAKAVAELLKQQGWNIHWLGTADRMEATLVPQFGFPFHSIAVAGLRGKGLKSLIKAPLMLWRSVSQARALIKQLKPDLVLGFGGYASGPGGLAAYLAGKPLIVHEQNAVAGTTNRLLARIAKKVLVAFPQAFADRKDRIVVGNPVRAEVLAVSGQKQLQAPTQSLKVLVVGGSLGAQVFNQQLPALFAQAATAGELEIRHQTGKAMEQQVQQAYAALPELQASASAFIEDMAAAYTWADLVICRAGALTVSEVACAGVAAVFVPLPSAIDDHQTANASWLVQKQGAVLLPQSEFSKGALLPLLQSWLQDKSALRHLANNARRTAIDDAAEQVVRVCGEVIGMTK